MKRLLKKYYYKVKKKINYNNIPKKVLKIVIGETYGLGDYTVKDEIDKYGQDIIAARWLVERGKLMWFHAWTKDYVMALVDTMFNDQVILGLSREPPKELLK